jgi:hypothetical protein
MLNEFGFSTKSLQLSKLIKFSIHEINEIISYINILMINNLFYEAFYFQRNIRNNFSFDNQSKELILFHFLKHCLIDKNIILLYELDLDFYEQNLFIKLLKENSKDYKDKLSVFYIQRNYFKIPTEKNEILSIDINTNLRNAILSNYNLSLPIIQNLHLSHFIDHNIQGLFFNLYLFILLIYIF